MPTSVILDFPVGADGHGPHPHPHLRWKSLLHIHLTAVHSTQMLHVYLCSSKAHTHAFKQIYTHAYI